MKEIHATFQITRKIMFNVEYKKVGSNKSAYFTTSADVFNQPKSGYNQFGQCQKQVLSGLALKFWIKWNKKHFAALTNEEYKQLLTDIEALKNAYNHIVQDFDITFSLQKMLSKLKLK